MAHPTAPHGDDRQPSRLTQRAPGVPGDEPHPGFAGSRLLDDPTVGVLRPVSGPEPPRGLEPGDASLPLGAADADPVWQAGARDSAAGGGQRAAAGPGDADRSAPPASH